MKPEFTGKRLRHFRLQRQWSVQELSTATSISQRQIERIEDGVAEKVHPLILEKLADALLIELQDLLEESPPPEAPPPIPRTLGEITDRLADFFAVVIVAVSVVLFATLIHLIGGFALKPMIHFFDYLQ